jgi:hypothetical protein
LISKFTCITSSSDTGRTMHMFSMALALFIVRNSSIDGKGSSLEGWGLGGCEYYGFGLNGVVSGFGSLEFVR